MNARLLVAFALVAGAFAGCFDGDGTFEPGSDFEETGNTVHLRMSVVDLTRHEVYPGFQANLWAFCAEPADPNDEYSADAIEYLPQQGDVSEGIWDGKCSVPGPTIRVKQGDRVIVDFEHQHFHAHTIHWHGQFVPWRSDGVPGSTQDSVLLGETFRYEYIAKRAGTLWYHCHVDTQFHVMQGLYGVIIVEPQDTSLEPKDIDEEYVWVLGNLRRDLVEYIPPEPGEFVDPHADHRHGSACGASGQPGCQNPPADITPDVFMINGVSFPNTVAREDTLITIAPGEKIRLRILNAGPTTIETLHPHGHDMYITHKDGNPLPLDARYWVDTLRIGPGERYDVVIEGKEEQAGIWVFHTHITSHVTNDQQYPGGMLTKLVYEGFEDDLSPFVGAELPGGQGFVRTVEIPEDHIDSARFDLGTDNEVSETWSFPVGAPCAVKRLDFTASARASNGALQNLNELTVTITGPEEAVVKEIALGSSVTGNWSATASDLVEGTYDVAVTGQAADTVLDLSVFVDYHGSMDEISAAGQTC